ncbi:MAG: molybdate ABC transporter substrate-binding protein [Myxococcota bacterium]|nr:molybdate ABC transporter substrate-binding protein [Myxococcota bacterium]
MKSFVSAVVCAGTILNACACSSQPTDPILAIYAASSLASVADALTEDFRQLEPNLKVEFNYAGSQTLWRQIEHGAPADLFLSADPEHLTALKRQGLARELVTFAQNDLGIITPKRAHKVIQKLDDLVDADRLVFGTPEVPVGRHARAVIASQGATFQKMIFDRVVSWEPSARLALSKLSLGEADATLGYRSDALNRIDLDFIELPTEALQTATYWSGIITGTQIPNVAKRFQNHLTSSKSQQTLRRHGFGGKP